MTALKKDDDAMDHLLLEDAVDGARLLPNHLAVNLSLFLIDRECNEYAVISQFVQCVARMR